MTRHRHPQRSRNDRPHRIRSALPAVSLRAESGPTDLRRSADLRTFWLFAVLIGGRSLTASAEPDHRLALSVMQIHAYTGNGRTFFGSGVAVAPNRVATNCHVTRTARAIAVGKGLDRLTAVAQQADPLHDLCILEVPELGVPPVKIGSAARTAVGTTIDFYGYPRALGMAYSQGRIEALHPFEGGLIIETNADFTQGASGGGLFDQQGELVGLATFMPSRQGGHNYAIPADWIPSLLATASRRIEPMSGSPFWENPATLPAFLQVPRPH